MSTLVLYAFEGITIEIQSIKEDEVRKVRLDVLICIIEYSSRSAAVFPVVPLLLALMNLSCWRKLCNGGIQDTDVIGTG